MLVDKDFADIAEKSYVAGKYGTEIAYTTPRYVFEPLHRELGFTVDVCALPENARLPRHFTPEIDGLSQNWSGEVCWMNPPWGRGLIDRWLSKALHSKATVAALVPTRTSSPWFHDYVMKAAEVRFIRHKISFVNTLTNEKYQPFLGCAVAIFRGGIEHKPQFSSWRVNKCS